MTEIACAVASHDTLGECCLWCPRSRRLWWLDIQRPCLQSYDPISRTHRVHPLPGRFCGCAALRAQGGFVVALDGGLHGFDPDSGRIEFLTQPEPDMPGNRYNDGRCDRQGRLWIGTMDIGIAAASGSLYRIGPGLAVERQFGGITVPNSTAISPDNRTFYFSDTPRHIIWAYDFDLAAGALGRRRVFADLGDRGGLPDGSCVDAEGYLWNAEYAGGRVTRYAPDGQIDRVVELPVTNPTCCCFGGDALDTLYVTSATPKPGDPRRPLDGALLAFVPGVRGLPEAAFAG